MKNKYASLIMPLVASLTLGLAPFFPEPHIIGKIRWILGGAQGMELMDWFDLIMHGAPFIWLFTVLILILAKGRKSEQQKQNALKINTKTD